MSKLPIHLINKILHVAALSGYSREFSKEEEWTPLAYIKEGVVFRKSNVASDEEPFFDDLGLYNIFYRPDGVFFGLFHRDSDIAVVCGKEGDTIRIGDIVNGREVFLLGLSEGALYINGERFDGFVKPSIVKRFLIFLAKTFRLRTIV